MKKIILLSLTLIFSQAQAQDGGDFLEIGGDSLELFTAPLDIDAIVGDFDYDLVEDRLQCLEQTIPLNFNERVYAFINYFAVKDRDYTRLMLQRKDVYFPIFEKYLKKYDLPEELKYLSIIESGLNPKAVSSAKAVGLWQFMPLTGRYFDLHQDWYIDERMDPERATEAACRYLKQLYGMFGDWELAIAAYNTGPGNVRKAIRRSGYKKHFWEIYRNLHRETRSYLPQFVAMIYVMNYSEEHNIFPEEIEYLPKFDTVLVSNYLHLETFAHQLGLCLDDLQKLNPGLVRNALPENAKNYPIRVPFDVKMKFEENRMAILDSASNVGREELKALAKNTIGSTYGRNKIVYRVRSGDVLGIIARRYGVRIDDIRKWNNIRGNLIRVGQPLSIWVKGAPTTSQTYAKNQEIPSSKIHVVQPGDTLWDISRRYEGLTIEKIKELNNLTTGKIKPGQKLKLG